MKPRHLIAIILILSAIPLSTGAGAGPLVITPLKDDFSGVPGDTVIIPFRLTNLGNSTIENVTVYITGPAQGFLYQSKIIRKPIEPNGTVEDTLSVKILNVPPGRYNLTLVARFGSVYSDAGVHLTVKTLVDYDLAIDVGREYPYGRNVSVVMAVTSRANGIIIGRVGYTITRDGKRVQYFATTIYLNPGESWIRNVTLTRPPVGNYNVRLWAYFGGKYKSETASFRVFQRNLGYEAYYRNGAIHVFVHDDNGRGVPGIPVKINGRLLMTDDDGTVVHPVSEPGAYEVTLDLDGKIVTTVVEVRKLFISYEQSNDTLLVRVVDSTGKPVSNVTVIAIGPLGRDYATTNASGMAVVNLKKTGYGTIILRAESSEYVGGSITARAFEPPKPSPTTTPTRTTPVVTTVPKPPEGHWRTPLILVLSGLLLAGTSYASLFRPLVHEEKAGRHYFLKIRAPRLKGIDNLKLERSVNAVEVRTTKGSARVENGKVIWEIDHLEPGEEAYLQVLLG